MATRKTSAKSNEKKPSSKVANSTSKKKPQKAVSVKQSTAKSKTIVSNKKQSEKSALSAKFESITKNIDLLQNGTFGNDVVLLQNVLDDSYKDLSYILKAIPKIDDSSILKTYDKVYKKLVNLANSLNISIDSINDNTINNSVLDIANGNDIILLEKINDPEGEVFFRIKYFNEVSNIRYYSEKGELSKNYRLNSEGKWDLVTNGFVIDTNDAIPYNESKYKVIESVTLDKSLYSTSLIKNQIALNIVNLIFENRGLQIAIENFKNNKLFNIKVNISNLSPNRYSTPDNNHSIQNKIDNAKHNNETNQAILEDFFILGTNILLYGPTKQGKTFFAIWLAQECYIKRLINKACFFAFEDENETQLGRYEEILKKYEKCIITGKKWGEYAEKKRNNAKKKETLKSLLSKKQKAMLSIINNHENDAIDLGSNVDSQINLIIFLELLQEKINEGYDFFVLDSLSSIYDNISYINASYIKKLISIPSRYNFTFILIHHSPSNSRTPFGGQKVSINFDNSCYLEIIEKPSKLKQFHTLKLSFDNRAPEKGNLYIKRTEISKNIAKHEIIKKYDEEISLKNEKSTLKNQILKFVIESGNKGCSIEDLCKHFKKVRPSTTRKVIRNELSEWEELGKIEQLKKKWEKIIAIK